MKNAIAALLAAFLAASVSLAAPFNDGFADTRVASYLENAGKLHEDATLTKLPGMTGKNCLQLTYDNEIVSEFVKVPVNDATPYLLTFRGQWKNGETLDNNPTYEAALTETWRNALIFVPTLDVIFYDTEDKQLKEGIFLTMPYGDWREYRNVFYPPTGAVTMQLKIKPSRNEGIFYMDNVEFEPIKNAPGEILLNFNYGKAEYSGSLFGFRVDGAIRVLADGRRLLNSGYGTASNAITLSGPGTYRLAFKGELLRGSGACNVEVQFLDAAGKKIGQATSAKLDAGPLDFTLPQGVERIRLAFWNHWIEEIRISKIQAAPGAAGK